MGSSTFHGGWHIIWGGVKQKKTVEIVLDNLVALGALLPITPKTV